MALVEAPIMEMASNPTGWHCKKPVKSRRRVLCPVLLPNEREKMRDLPPSERWKPTRGKSNDQTSYCLDQPPSHMFSPSPITVSVRLLYFSHDGAQADNGAVHEITTNTAASAEELLRMVQAAAGVKSGRLLFKMRPASLSKSLGELGVMADPKGFHLMLNRKFRPHDVAAKAEIEAAKISEHIAAAAAAAPPKQPRQKRPLTPDSSTEGCSP